LLSNTILKNHLFPLFSSSAWLSEESPDDLKRLTCSYVWIVDPIDGTKEYVAFIPEYSISVALIHNGTPILAAIYNPATDELFYAIKNQGAYLQNKLNKKKLNCHDQLVNRKITLLASRAEYQRGDWKRYELLYQVKSVGSIAYKMALVAAGVGDATFSLGSKNVWDVAAGVLIVTEAGGIVTDIQGKQLHFNLDRVGINGIIASNVTMNKQINCLVSQS
jgi:myo-inositol-1(or 4)-monophosphatase